MQGYEEFVSIMMKISIEPQFYIFSMNEAIRKARDEPKDLSKLVTRISMKHRFVAEDVKITSAVEDLGVMTSDVPTTTLSGTIPVDHTIFAKEYNTGLFEGPHIEASYQNPSVRAFNFTFKSEDDE